jgi:hypothetical protein
MDQGNAIVGQHITQPGKKFGVILFADMLEHADRYDAIIGTGFLAVIAQFEHALAAEAGHAGAFAANLVLVDTERHAGDMAAGLSSAISA